MEGSTWGSGSPQWSPLPHFAPARGKQGRDKLQRKEERKKGKDGRERKVKTGREKGEREGQESEKNKQRRKGREGNSKNVRGEGNGEKSNEGMKELGEELRIK